MKEENCIFCKIANGEIPSKTLYEDDKFRVILDLGPASKGHALILPKDHYANLYELPDETAGEVMKLAKRMAVQMTERLGCEGFNLVQNNGELAGQTVFHFHMHRTEDRMETAGDHTRRTGRDQEADHRVTSVSKADKRTVAGRRERTR